MKYLTVILITTWTTLAATTPLQEDMLQDLFSIHNQVSIKYAPDEWKKEHFGFGYDQAFEIAKDRIVNENPQTSKEYQQILTQCLKSTHDYHVNPMYFSNAISLAPLEVNRINSRYYLSLELIWNISFTFDEIMAMNLEEADESLLSNYMEIEAGDELLAIDGIPVQKIIDANIHNFLAEDNSLTGQMLAERMLFYRRGQFGHDCPGGTFTVTVLKQGESTPKPITLPWILHSPEMIPHRSIKKKEMMSRSDRLKQALWKDFSVALMENPLKQLKVKATDFEDDESEEESDYREKGFLPPLGNIIWETDPYDSDIYAYLYENNEGSKIGYLYLNDFMKSEYFFVEILEILEKFESESAALVIDIQNNGGGSLFFMYAFLSALTDRPLKTPLESQTIIQDDLYNAVVIKNMTQMFIDDNEDCNLDGYQLDRDEMEQILSYQDFLFSTWNAGLNKTPLNYFYGIDRIKPNKQVRYTKPIVVLINPLCFSCADFFPAILQDNNRAHLFGQRTAGAGGSVIACPCTSQFGVAGFTLTASIAYRQDGNPIENLGVTPDTEYQITEKDLKEEYTEMIDAINLQIKKMVD